MAFLLMIILVVSTVYIGLEAQRYARIIDHEQAIRKNLLLTSAFKVALAAIIGGICLDLLTEKHGLFTFANLLLVLTIIGGFTIIKKQSF